MQVQFMFVRDKGGRFFKIDLVNTGAWIVTATEDEGEQAVHSLAHHVEISTSCELSQNFTVMIFGVYTFSNL